jgi:hypothetical protein
MRALVWIVEDTWQATVAEAAAFLPADAEVTLLHVAPADVETLAAGARHGLLGRPRHPPPPPHPPPPLRAISEEAAAALLAEARARFGRDANREACAAGSSTRLWPPPTRWTSSSSRATATARTPARTASAPRRASSSITCRAGCCWSGPR